MCRLYAFRARAPVSVAADLVHDRNALVKQSRQDLKGRSHADGWGIGFHEGTTARVERGALPAYDDPGFRTAAAGLHADTVVAHVRDASVGSRSVVNAHPFAHGPWLFAHNGTVNAFEKVSPLLEAETPQALLRQRQGATDSELVFYWLLGRIAAAGCPLASTGAELPDLVRLLGTAVRDLAARCDRAGAAEPAKLNFLLTDGVVLLTSRWGHSLQWLERDPGRAVVVASEPTGDGPWQEVPDRGILTVDASLGVSWHPLLNS